jgi:4-amino-4-deoxychorismate lyase
MRGPTKTGAKASRDAFRLKNNTLIRFNAHQPFNLISLLRHACCCQSFRQPAVSRISTLLCPDNLILSTGSHDNIIMVKFYTASHTYDFSFPTVSLAYFLRYPNPYSTHVLSTDVIERSFDPVTQRLYSTRLHLKRSKLPSGILKLIPRSILGSSARTGDSQSYILERSTVDIREGWMKTESRNLEWTGVLSVIERQTYTPGSVEHLAFSSSSFSDLPKPMLRTSADMDERTDVTTAVTLHSRLGQRLRRHRAATTEAENDDELPEKKVGFFRSWSQASLQRSIEAIGLRRTSKSQPNAKEGMRIVLERLRKGGLTEVLEGMRRDREQRS